MAIVVVFLLFTLVFVVLWHQKHVFRLTWQLSGPFPLLGSNLAWINVSEIIPFFDHLSQVYRSPIRLFIGPKPIIFISDAENAKVILNSKDCLNKPDQFYKAFRDALSFDGLITLEASKWKLHRRLVRPSVSLSSVTTQLDIFNRCIRQSIASLKANEQFEDILPPITICMMNIFLEACLGGDLDPGAKQKYLENFTNGQKIVMKRMLAPILQIDIIWKLTKSAKTLKKYQQYGRSLFLKVISEKLQTPGDGDSLIEKLYEVTQHNQQFTLDDVAAETATILGGATDTLAIGIAFTAVLLALHPEYQKQVYNEVLAVMPNADMDLTQADIDKLEFTDLCIREALRLFPSIPLIARYPTKSIKLTNGVEIPADIPIVIGLRQTQMQKEYYGPTAIQYNPNRLLDPNVINLPSTTNMPFSYGPRNCIGNFYAQVCLKLYVAYLIRNYYLETSYKNIEELKPLLSIGMVLVDKHMIKLIPRN